MVAEAERAELIRPTVLVLEDDPDLAALYTEVLEDAGFNADVVRNGQEGLAYLEQSIPDLVISDIMMPVMDGLAFLTAVREETELRFLPVILLTTRSNIDDVVTGFAIGADDYVAKPVDPRELVMRVRAKIERPPVPVETLETDRKSGLLNEAGLMAAVEAELQRAERGNYRCAVAAIDIYEHARLLTYFGHRAEAGIANTFGKMLLDWARPLDVAARLDDGTFIVFMPECDPDTAGDRLEALTRRVVHSRLQVGEEEISITPISGYSEAETNMPFERSLEEARIAAKAAESHLDLRPMPFDPLMVAAPPTQSLLARAMAYLEWFRLPFQILLTYVIGFLMPFGVYVAFGSLGFDITQPVYYGAVTVMLVTCVLIWAEGFLSLKRTELPEVAEEDFGGVTAIIAAYLPNEAPTLESTIEAFLRMDYPAEFKVILAYNTPVDMPIEARLREIARADPRFVPFRVPSSRSKAQNVNAALSLVRTPVVAVYDADHQPDPDSFRRAWRWMADGADVVQGHCLIRNGESSWVARTVAIEFEQIYAVNHYGRMKLHDFGLFGGSNGFWRADLLRELRMRGSMLTEDIDSSIRAVQRGCRIVSDPLLISRELAPTTLKGLTNQRLRWAQGWYQVVLRQIWPCMKAKNLSIRQKVGMFHLLAWREAFPWMSMQIVPIVAYDWWRKGYMDLSGWTNGILFWITLFILLTGPGQMIFTWFRADPSFRRNRAWFWGFMIRSIFFYAGYKNLLARVANLKEASGERAWKVTPR